MLNAFKLLFFNLKKSGPALALFFLFLFFIVSTNLVSAISVPYDNSDSPKVVINKTTTTPTNYSLVTVNNSIFWSGHIWSEVSPWLYNMTVPANAYTDSQILSSQYWNQSSSAIYQNNLSMLVGIGTNIPSTGVQLEVQSDNDTFVTIDGGGNQNSTLEFREGGIVRAWIEYGGKQGLLSFWSRYADAQYDNMLSMNTRTNLIAIVGNLTVDGSIWAKDNLTAPNICYTNGTGCSGANVSAVNGTGIYLRKDGDNATGIYNFTGNYTFNKNRFFVNSTSVGIGTNTPFGTFEVVGGAAILDGVTAGAYNADDGALFVTNYITIGGAPAAGEDLNVYESGITTTMRMTDSLTGTGATNGLKIELEGQQNRSTFWNYENGPMIFGTNNTEAMRLNGVNNLYTMNVSGNITADWFLGNVKTYNSTYDSKADYQFGNNNFNGSGNFSTSGKVGIGTTSPSSALHVVKADEVPIYADMYSNTNYAAGIVGRRARGSSTSPTAIQADDYITAIFGRGYNGSTFSTSSMGIVGVLAESAWSGTTTPTYINFRTASSGSTSSTERMRITSTGNVGIGTNNPGNLLTINGTGMLQLKANITTMVCNSTNAGSMYYDGSKYQHYGCNSTDWISIKDYVATGVNNITGNLNVVGNFTGNQIYGEMYCKNDSGCGTIDLVTKEVYGAMYNQTAGNNNGFMLVGGTNLTSLVSGLYMINAKATVTAVSPAGEFGMKVFVDESGQNNCYDHFHVDLTEVSMVLTCLTRINAGQNLSIRFDDHVNPVTDLIIYATNLNAVRIGN